MGCHAPLQEIFLGWYLLSSWIEVDHRSKYIPPKQSHNSCNKSTCYMGVISTISWMTRLGYRMVGKLAWDPNSVLELGFKFKPQGQHSPPELLFGALGECCPLELCRVPASPNRAQQWILEADSYERCMRDYSGKKLHRSVGEMQKAWTLFGQW